jgi:hypothetical protein
LRKIKCAENKRNSHAKISPGKAWGLVRREYQQQGLWGCDVKWIKLPKNRVRNFVVAETVHLNTNLKKTCSPSWIVFPTYTLSKKKTGNRKTWHITLKNCLLGCYTVQCGRSLPTFQRCSLPPSPKTMEAKYKAGTSAHF